MFILFLKYSRCRSGVCVSMKSGVQNARCDSFQDIEWMVAAEEDLFHLQVLSYLSPQIPSCRFQYTTLFPGGTDTENQKCPRRACCGSPGASYVRCALAHTTSEASTRESFPACPVLALFNGPVPCYNKKKRNRVIFWNFMAPSAPPVPSRRPCSAWWKLA